MEEYYDDDFQQSGGGKWIKWIGVIVYIAIILAYAWQTLELVSWLFPADNLAMRVITVFICDGCATGYAMAEMFYRFRLKTSKHLVFGMWIVTFIFSTAASVIQLYLSSTHLIPHTIDSGVIYVAYGIVIAAFVVNIITITVIIRLEYNASQPSRRYLDEKTKKKRQIPQETPQSSASFAQTSHASDRTHVQQETGPLQGMLSPDEVAEYRRLKAQQKQSGPLA